MVTPTVSVSVGSDYLDVSIEACFKASLDEVDQKTEQVAEVSRETARLLNDQQRDDGVGEDVNRIETSDDAKEDEREDSDNNDERETREAPDSSALHTLDSAYSEEVFIEAAFETVLDESIFPTYFPKDEREDSDYNDERETQEAPDSSALHTLGSTYSEDVFIEAAFETVLDESSFPTYFPKEEKIVENDDENKNEMEHNEEVADTNKGQPLNKDIQEPKHEAEGDEEKFERPDDVTKSQEASDLQKEAAECKNVVENNDEDTKEPEHIEEVTDTNKDTQELKHDAEGDEAKAELSADVNECQDISDVEHKMLVNDEDTKEPEHIEEVTDTNKDQPSNKDTQELKHDAEGDEAKAEVSADVNECQEVSDVEHKMLVDHILAEADSEDRIITKDDTETGKPKEVENVPHKDDRTDNAPYSDTSAALSELSYSEDDEETGIEQPEEVAPDDEVISKDEGLQPEHDAPKGEVEEDGFQEPACQGIVHQEDSSEENKWLIASEKTSFLEEIEATISQHDPSRKEELHCQQTTLENILGLIEKRDWSNFIETINKFPDIVSMSASEQSSFLGSGSSGNTLLHELCKNEPTLEVVCALLAINVEAANAQGQWGYLPLHYACASGASVAVVDALVKASPKSLSASDSIEGMLPLHVACKRGASEDVLEFLLASFPEAALVHDSYEKTPMDYAMSLPKTSNRDNTVDCIQRGLKKNVGALADALSRSRTMLETEKEKVQALEKQKLDLERELESESQKSPHFLLAFALSRMAVLEQSRVDKDLELENLLSKIESLELELAESQLLVRAERKRVDTEKLKGMEDKLKLEKSKASALERSLVKRQELLEAEHEKAKDMEQKLQELQTRFEAERLEKSQADLELEKLQSKVESLDLQLAESQLLLGAERKGAERKRVDTEKAKEMEKSLLALEQSLVRRQEILETEREKAKAMEHEFQELQARFEVEKARAQKLEEDLNGSKKTDASPSIELPETTNEETRVVDYGLALEENEAMLKQNKDIIRALEESNVKKQELLESQQEKVEALEKTKRRKEYILHTNQVITKSLEESIARKEALNKTEEEKIRTLEDLKAKKKKMLESEEEEVKNLDYALARKEALLELEQMKEKTLEQTIAQKNALLESETTKVKDLEMVCAGKNLLMVSEQNMVKAFESAKREKEALFESERNLVIELIRTQSEKETILESKRKTQEEIQKRVDETKALLEMEEKLIECIRVARAERESLLEAEKVAVKETEQKLAKKETLLKKERDITRALQMYQTERREMVASGKVYYVINATLSLSHLFKEAFLASQHEKSLRSKTNVLVRRAVQAPSYIMKKTLGLEGKKYVSKFASFLGVKPSQLTKFASFLGVKPSQQNPIKKE